MIRKFAFFTVALAILTMPSIIGAQTQTPVDVSAKGGTAQNAQPDRAAIISYTMDFSPKDATAFWPIYQEYERERSALYDRRIVVLKEYEEKYLSMSDDDAKAMANRMFEYDSQAMEVNRKYFKKFSKVLPTYTVVKFFQVEHRIDLMMEAKATPPLPPLPELEQEKGQD